MCAGGEGDRQMYQRKFSVCLYYKTVGRENANSCIFSKAVLSASVRIEYMCCRCGVARAFAT